MSKKLPHADTVEEAVTIVLGWLTEDAKTAIKAQSERQLAMFHHGLGTYIRNGLRLWGAHGAKLRAACGTNCPDSASGVIIKALWRRLQEEDVPKTQERKDPRDY